MAALSVEERREKQRVIRQARKELAAKGHHVRRFSGRGRWSNGTCMGCFLGVEIDLSDEKKVR